MKGGLALSPLWGALFLSLFSVSLLSYYYIEWENQQRLIKAALVKEMRRREDLKEDICLLQWKIEEKESPARLLHLLQQPPFSHLSYPSASQVLFVEEGGE